MNDYDTMFWALMVASWIVGLSPSVLGRYVVLRRPFSVTGAVLFLVVQWIVMTIAWLAFEGNATQGQGAMWLLLFISYQILRSGHSKCQDSSSLPSEQLDNNPDDMFATQTDREFKPLEAKSENHEDSIGHSVKGNRLNPRNVSVYGAGRDREHGDGSELKRSRLDDIKHRIKNWKSIHLLFSSHFASVFTIPAMDDTWWLAFQIGDDWGTKDVEVFAFVSWVLAITFTFMSIYFLKGLAALGEGYRRLAIAVTVAVSVIVFLAVLLSFGDSINRLGLSLAYTAAFSVPAGLYLIGLTYFWVMVGFSKDELN